MPRIYDDEMYRPVPVVLLIIGFVVASCRAASDPSTGARAKPGEADTGVLPACLDEDHREESRPLTGDVDGDGADDTVTVVVDSGGEPRCRAFLVVRAADTLVTPLEVLDESVFRLGLPTPNLLADIDGAPGKEIVVNVHAGASTQFASVFTIRDSRLVRISIDGADDLVPFGGSATHLEGADCAAGGAFVIASAVSRGRRYVVTRRFLRPRGTALAVDREERRTVPPRDLNSVPEFASPPFGSCR